MIETRLLEVVPETNVTRWFHYDDETGEVTIETAHDVQNVLDAAKSRFNDTDERAPWRGDMEHVGWVPLEILTKLSRENPVYEDYQRALKRWLNDPDNRAFRSRPGRV